MRAIYSVTSNCTDPARDAEFNQWYDQVHIPYVLRAHGFVEASRYRLIGNGPQGQGRYLVNYEIDSDDPERDLAVLREKASALRASDEWIDCIEVVSTALYERL